MDCAVLAKRFEAFRMADRERDDMVKDMVKEVENLQNTLAGVLDDCKNEADSRRRLQVEVRTLKNLLNDEKRATESSNLVYVLIDGDGAVFQDELLAKSKEGGAEAANQLLTEIKKHLRAQYPEASVVDWNIVAQIYVNLEGMSKKLLACGLIKSTKEVVDFARAFTNAQPLFSIVDVGPGKELADHKIREMLRGVVRNKQVRQIVVGPCHDNGYLPVLRPYNSELATSEKITLLDTTPAQPGFADLTAFERLSLPGIFRSEPLPERPDERTSSVSPVSQPAFLATAKPANGGSWASLSKTHDGNFPNGIVIDVGAKKAKAKFYMVNKYDERVDEPIRSSRLDPEIEQRYNKKTKDVRPCNVYHLSGKCDNDYCQYTHEGLNFTPEELTILRAKARSGRCTAEGACDDVDCPYSHHCRYARNCHLEDRCRFKDSHHIDLTPVKRIYEDGREELLSA